MKTRLSRERVFALKGWSVKVTEGKFWVSPTAHFESKPQWKGPYKSLQHATNAIARKLQAEFTERNKRLERV